jgi:lipoic acid synthetase
MTVRHPEKVNNIENPIQKKPAWIKVRASYSQEYIDTKNILKKNNLLLKYKQ